MYCAAVGVKVIRLGDLRSLREGNDKGDDANQKIHSFFQYAYRAERYRMTAEEYIFKVKLESEENSSRDCSICKERHRNGRKYRGLYHCRRYDVIMNADVNASENLLNGRKVSPGPVRLPAKADSACGRVSQRGEQQLGGDGPNGSTALESEQQSVGTENLPAFTRESVKAVTPAYT
jgi:transposase